MSIPVAYAAGVLRMEQLYLVTFVEGCLGALFDAAYPAYVPSLIGVDRVVNGNSKLATSSSLAEIGGPGWPVRWSSWSALHSRSSSMRWRSQCRRCRCCHPDARATTTGEDDSDGDPRGDLEGLRLVRHHRVLLPMAMRSVVGHVAGSFYGVLYTIYLIDDLHLSPFLLGVVVSAGGVGSLVGSLFAQRVIRRLGIGPAMIWTAVGASALGILTPLAQGPVLLATIMVFIPQLFGDGLQTIEGVAELSLVQGLSPDRVLGRVNATFDVLSHGIAYPIGALVAAGVAGVIGVRGGIAIGWAGMAVSILFLVLSPLPRIRTISDEKAAEG